AKEAERRSQASLEQAEKALADWQEQWDAWTLASNEAQQVVSVEQTRAEQLESRLRSLAERRRKLDESSIAANPDELKAEFDKLAVQEYRARQARDEFERALADITEQIRKLREQDQKLSRLVDERHAALQAA